MRNPAEPYMNSRDSRYGILSVITFGILCLANLAASAEEWPITFTTIPITSSDYKGGNYTETYDCQPDLFDPMKDWYRKVEPSEGLVGISSSSADIYEIKGEDESVTMTIDSSINQGDSRILLPDPYSLTVYDFSCASEFSQVFELKKNGRRYALYTHIIQASFSPDKKKLVLFNYLKDAKGGWQEYRRIIDIDTKKFSLLPVIKETAYLADMTNDKVVTYSSPIPSPTESDTRRRIVGIWDHEGQLIRALSAPLQITDANAESSDDGIGLLPSETTTFYHLTRTGENVCTLRLQDIQHLEKHRSIRLVVPGSASEPAAVGMRIQIDLANLKLNDGTMKYRVSTGGRGDVSNDWGPWQVVK